MDRVYLLDTDDLTQYGFVNGDVEEEILVQCIYRVQETQLQPILGTPLFNKMKSEMTGWFNGTIPKSGDYYELWVNYIIPALIPMVEIKVTFHTTSEIENKGTGTSRDEFFNPNTINQNNNLRDELRKDATHFKNQLIKHLCDDKGVKYPEYKEYTSNTEDFKPEDSGPDYENQMFIM